jgi:hypothetical protein
LIVAFAALWLLVLTGELALVLGGVTLIAAGSCLIVGYRRATAQILVFDNGFSYRQGGRPVFFRWEDINAVWDQSRQITVEGAPVGPVTRVLIIKRYDGKKVKVSSVFKGVKEFVNLVTEKVYDRQMPQAVELLNNGAEARFGRIGITKAGLRVKHSFLPWDMVKSVRVQGGCLVIHQKGRLRKWASVHLESTPNLFVLFPLLQGMACPE